MEDNNVVPEPEDTTPAPEVAPPAVHPDPPNEIASLREEFNRRIDELTEAVNGVLNNASPTPDSTPVKKPWTHFGSK